MAKLRIDGDHNIQVGHVHGDLVIDQDEPLDADNPNLVQCPACPKRASWAASACPRCGYPIAAHFAAIARKAQRELLMKRVWALVGVFIVGFMLTNASWMPESVKVFVGAMSAVSILLAGFMASAAEKLR